MDSADSDWRLITSECSLLCSSKMKMFHEVPVQVLVYGEIIFAVLFEFVSFENVFLV